MGCGGSKEEVASGNTTTSAGLLRRKSSVADGKTATATTEETKPVADVDKEVTVEEEGKLIARDSPDRYFSSRKEYEATSVDGDAGPGYHTPAAEDLVPRAVAAGGAMVVVEEEGSGTPSAVAELAAVAEETEKKEEPVLGDGTKTVAMEESGNESTKEPEISTEPTLMEESNLTSAAVQKDIVEDSKVETIA